MGGKLAKASVFRGSKEKTYTGLMKTNTWKIVTKKQHAAGKKAYANIKGWTLAVQKARKALGVKGFKAVKKGSPLYTKAKEIYGQRARQPLLRESVGGTLSRPPRCVGS